VLFKKSLSVQWNFEMEEVTPLAPLSILSIKAHRKMKLDFQKNFRIKAK
jgi:hypothetical protein